MMNTPRPFPIPLVPLGPGSQRDDEPLAFIAMPKDMSTYQPPPLPEPEALEDVSWGPILERRRIVMKDARAAYWMRIRGMRTLDPAMQACALAFASDDVPTEAAKIQELYLSGRKQEATDAVPDELVDAGELRRPDLDRVAEQLVLPEGLVGAHGRRCNLV